MKTENMGFKWAEFSWHFVLIWGCVFILSTLLIGIISISSKNTSQTIIIEKKNVTCFEGCEVKEIRSNDIIFPFDYINATISKDSVYLVRVDDLEYISKKYNQPIVCGEYPEKTDYTDKIIDYFIDNGDLIVNIPYDDALIDGSNCNKTLTFEDRERFMRLDGTGRYYPEIYCCSENYCVDMGKEIAEQYFECKCGVCEK